MGADFVAFTLLVLVRRLGAFAFVPATFNDPFGLPGPFGGGIESPIPPSISPLPLPGGGVGG